MKNEKNTNIETKYSHLFLMINHNNLQYHHTNIPLKNKNLNQSCNYRRRSCDDSAASQSRAAAVMRRSRGRGGGGGMKAAVVTVLARERHRSGSRREVVVVAGGEDSHLQLLPLLAVAVGAADEEEEAGFVKGNSGISVTVGFDGVFSAACFVVCFAHFQNRINLSVVLQNYNIFFKLIKKNMNINKIDESRNEKVYQWNLRFRSEFFGPTCRRHLGKKESAIYRKYMKFSSFHNGEEMSHSQAEN